MSVCLTKNSGMMMVVWMMFIGLMACTAMGSASRESLSQNRTHDLRPPAPWTPVRYRPHDQTVEVWGRQYQFTHGPIPHVRSQETLHLGSDSNLQVEGKPIVWNKPRLIKQVPNQVQLAFQGHTSAAQWEADVTVAYDGLIWITLRAHAPSEQRAVLHSVRLAITVGQDDATFYSHQFVRTSKLKLYWRADLAPTPEKLWGGGALPDQGWHGQFTPQLWIGGYQRGLAFIAQTPDTWHVDNDQDVMRLERHHGKKVTMTVDMITEPLVLTGKQRWQTDFGLMATPVRPTTDNHDAARIMFSGGGPLVSVQWKYNMTRDMTKSKINLMPAQGTRVFLLWNQWGDIWGFPTVTDPEAVERIKNFVDYAHGLGLKVIPYVTTMAFVPDAHPEFEKLKKRFQLSQEGITRKLYKKERQTLYLAKMSDDLVDWYVQQLRQSARQFGFDGVYLDAIHNPDHLVKNARIMYPYRAYRRLYEKIYRLFHGDLMENGIVFFHDSEPPIYMFNAFADAKLSGEMTYWAKIYRHELRQTHPGLGQRFPLSELFVWNSSLTSGQMPTYWCWKYVDQKTFSVGKGMVRSRVSLHDVVDNQEMFAFAGLIRADLIVAPDWMNRHTPMKQIAALWKLEDQFGASSHNWHGYWQMQDQVTANQPAIQMAGYIHPGQDMLLHIVNTSPQKQDFDLTFQSKSKLAHAPLKIKAVYPAAYQNAFSIQNNQVHGSLDANHYVRIWLEKSSDTKQP